MALVWEWVTPDTTAARQSSTLALVTPALYDRLEQLSSSVRESAAVALSQDTIGSIFDTYPNRQSLCGDDRLHTVVMSLYTVYCRLYSTLMSLTTGDETTLLCMC